MLDYRPSILFVTGRLSLNEASVSQLIIGAVRDPVEGL